MGTPISDINIIQEDSEDLYFTPNTLVPHKPRNSENISRITAIWQDIDYKNKHEPDYTKPLEERLAEVKEAVEVSGLPEPTAIINSGKGIHLYWIFNQKPPAKQWRDNWSLSMEEVGNRLQEALPFESIGTVDSAVYDLARIMRMPNSVNSRNGQKCEIVELNPSCLYDFKTDFYEVYAKPIRERNSQEWQAKHEQKETTEPTEKKKRKSNTGGYNRQARQDIIDLVRMRNGNMTGCRYNCLKALQRLKENPAVIIAVNNSFTDPLPKKQVDSILSIHYEKKTYITRRKMYSELLITPEETKLMKQLVPESTAQVKKTVTDNVKESKRKNRRALKWAMDLYISHYAKETDKTQKEAAKSIGQGYRSLQRYSGKKGYEDFVKQKEDLFKLVLESVTLGLDTLLLMARDDSFMDNVNYSDLFQDAKEACEMAKELKEIIEDNSVYKEQHGFSVTALESKCAELVALVS